MLSKHANVSVIPQPRRRGALGADDDDDDNDNDDDDHDDHQHHVLMVLLLPMMITLISTVMSRATLRRPAGTNTDEFVPAMSSVSATIFCSGQFL
jgi:hypothetical protein